MDNELLPAVVEATRARRQGAGYMGHCPAHEDKNSSLSFQAGDKGKLVFHCHAGCEYSHIEKALNMDMPTARNTAQVLKPFTSRKQKKKVAKVATAINVSELTLHRPLTPPVATYPYTDEGGNELYIKQRFHSKNDKYFRYSTKIDGLYYLGNHSGRFVLYRLPAIEAARADDPLVILCEGEKDVETLEALGMGLVATTNGEGAISWKAEYSEQLMDCRVCIMQDNDEAGRKRVEKLLGLLKKDCPYISMVAFDDMPEHSDVTDYLDQYTTLDEKRAALDAKLENAQVLYDATKAMFAPVPGRKKATMPEYIELIESLPDVAKLGRCLLTDELMAMSSSSGQWDYAANLESYVRSYAREYGDYFALTAIAEHMKRHERDNLKPRLLIDIPDWDGVDRIRQMSHTFIFSNVSKETFYQLVCHWGAGVFRRLEDPTYQNQCLVFQGLQGIGKDSLVAALSEAFEDYTKPLDIVEYGVDEARKQLHTAVVFNISEFDKTAKVDIAALKNLLTTPYTNDRLSYDKRPKKRKVRASFISSCNTKNILVDETGNRRFWIIECEYLGIVCENGHREFLDLYPGCWASTNAEAERKQILAQFKTMAAQGFTATREAIAEMNLYIEDMTPDSLEGNIREDYEAMMSAKVDEISPQLCKEGVDYYGYAQISGVVETLGKRYGMKPRRVIQELKPYKLRTNKTVFYRINLEEGESVPF